MGKIKNVLKSFLTNLAIILEDELDSEKNQNPVNTNNERDLNKSDKNGIFYRINENFKKPKPVSSRGCGCGKSKAKVLNNEDEEKKKENMKKNLFN
jgi:hypothetical protein